MGLGAASVGLLAAGVLPFYAVVVIAVFLIGFAKSVFDPALQAYVGEQVPYHRRGMVMGLIELPWAGSALVGIPLVGLLISRIGWQSPFLVLGALGFLCLIMIGLLIPSNAQHQQRQPAGIRQAWRQLGQEPAALTALALFAAYQRTVGLESINLTNPTTMIGLLLGAMMPFLIAAFTMEAVGRAADKMVQEIRRQFREIKGLLEGEAEPDVETCIDIVTKSALREMILPGVIAVAAPLLVGFIMGPEALGGFLAGATASSGVHPPHSAWCGWSAPTPRRRSPRCRWRSAECSRSGPSLRGLLRRGIRS